MDVLYLTQRISDWSQVIRWHVYGLDISLHHRNITDEDVELVLTLFLVGAISGHLSDEALLLVILFVRRKYPFIEFDLNF